jgi:hypothetical protein
MALAILTGGLVACGGEQAPEETAPAGNAELSSPNSVEAAGGNPAAETASQQIESDYMREIIAEISDDRYEGRGPGTRGDVMTREYLAKRMAELNLEPGGDNGSWEQPFDLVGINTLQPDSWTFTGNDKTVTLKQWDQYIVGSGVQNERSQFAL